MMTSDSSPATPRRPDAPIEAVIFDCDGTLVDSEPISIRVALEMFEQFGYETPREAAIKEWAGADLHAIIGEVETALGKPLPDDFLDTFRELQMQRLRQELKPIPGAAQLLRAVDKPRCVASNAPRVKMRCCLETTGLIELLDGVPLLSAYDVQAWKPRPDLFLHAAQQLGIAPSACAVVEDSQFGIEAGVAAGMQVFAYDHSSVLRDHPLVTNGRVDATSSLTALIPLLTS